MMMSMMMIMLYVKGWLKMKRLSKRRKRALYDEEIMDRIKMVFVGPGTKIFDDDPEDMSVEERTYPCLVICLVVLTSIVCSQIVFECSTSLFFNRHAPMIIAPRTATSST